jgi:hypothetical protein
MIAHIRSLDALLTTLHPANRRTYEHAGPCPLCGGDPQHSDRFRVWLEPGNERFWCRACNERGPLHKLFAEQSPRSSPIIYHKPRPRKQASAAPTHQEQYRQLYTAVALWASQNLHDPANPDALTYIQQRGFTPATAREQLLGVTRRDPQALVDYLRCDYPALLPYAEAAGILVSDGNNNLRTHANLCSCLVFPYIANGEITDLRTRSFPGKGYRSLPGGYDSRGAIFPFGWDSLEPGTNTVVLTEGEFKALAVTQAYVAGQFSAPALAHPGLSYLRPEWGQLLRERGVTTVILAYDSQPRPIRDGAIQLAPEEIWSLRHGASLAAAGLHVHILRLPLLQGVNKADLDEYILAQGPQRLQHLLDTAPRLETYQRSIPRDLLKRAKLRLPNSYPTRRARPKQLVQALAPSPPAPAINLATARTQIATLAREHAEHGKGFLVLAHPPGTGKGHNTALGLRTYLQTDPDPQQIVWSGLRKEQINDQHTLELIPLHGRNPGNCHKFDAAQALSSRGYDVHSTLCQRRCSFVDRCTYLRQFHQEGDQFAAQPMLQATGWWKEAGIIVLDEFDPGQLTRQVTLDSADLALITGQTNDSAAKSILRWLATLSSDCLDRSLAGALLLQELLKLAHQETLDFAQTLQAALNALPTNEEIQQLRGLPTGATLADYQSLAPNYLHIILQQLSRELTRYRSGQQFTSRFEISQGKLHLFLRIGHLIQQLSQPDQPKLILDATANIALLEAIFPDTPLQVEQPVITGGAHIKQVISRDWAKATLHGARRTAWYNSVAAQIRPDHQTLVVCTLACADDLRAALAERGHPDVIVAHYGSLRGSNKYKGYDIILAQVYNPNIDGIIREGRALFADEQEPLDERITLTERTLTDANGACWVVQVPVFADPRLTALLEQRREAELAQTALRGRPFDYPDAQITLLFGLPIPQLPPTVIQSDLPSATSNAGRTAAARKTLEEAVQLLLTQGKRIINVNDLAKVTRQSVVTIRKHLAAIAGRLGLRLVQQRHQTKYPKGGGRFYTRLVLLQRGRAVPQTEQHRQPAISVDQTPDHGTDHADNEDLITCVIRAFSGHSRLQTRNKGLQTAYKRRKGFKLYSRHHIKSPDQENSS